MSVVVGVVVGGFGDVGGGVGLLGAGGGGRVFGLRLGVGRIHAWSSEMR